MRTAIVVLTMTLMSGQTRSAPGQTLPADVGSGHIAWFELSTTDLARSKDFYARLFNWQFTPVEGTDQAAEIVADGAAPGAIAPRRWAGRSRPGLRSTCRAGSGPSPWSSILAAIQ